FGRGLLINCVARWSRPCNSRLHFQVQDVHVHDYTQAHPYWGNRHHVPFVTGHTEYIRTNDLFFILAFTHDIPLLAPFKANGLITCYEPTFVSGLGNYLPEILIPG